MSLDLNKHEFEVTCENGHTNKVTVADVRAKKTFKCRGCDQMISLQPDAKFDSEMRSAQKSLDDLKRTIDRFGR